MGTYSGPAGAVFNPFKDGVQLWVKHVNSRGGVNGHEVRLVVYDDGGDPARHRAQVQEAVEQRKVIGFLMNGDVIAGGSSVEYITQQRVPVVGTDTGTEYPYTSPMYFPSSSSGSYTMQAIVYSSAAQLAPLGKTKVGTLVCAEAQACAEVEKGYATHSAKAGLKHVYKGRASIAQPDFTAECLSAKNAGVEMLWAAMDQNSMGRISAACARQGYHPLYGAGSQNTSDGMRANQEFEGLIGTAFTFPYFQSGTPATDEFQTALKQYGAKITVGLSTAGGWVGAKLFEKAAANLPEPPTREALLAGLWSIKNETLGDLTQPLTFVKDRPQTGRACWFNFTIKDGEWRSPDNFALRCL